MGGKSGSTATNTQMVNMQMQQAAQSEAANAERNARLTEGANEINQMFQGVPSGATRVATQNVGLGPNFDPSTGYTWRVMPDDGSGVPQAGIYDPNGALVTSGTLDELSKANIYVPGTGDPNNVTGGFQPDFYNKYEQAQLNYYMPQEDQQYQDTRTGANYALARAGSLNSSIANQDITKLALQDQYNRLQIQSQADSATGALKNTVQQDQEAALNQLYSTEDPSVAANTAGNMVANASLTKPILNPLGPLFSAVTAGVGNAISGFTNPYAYINPGAQMMGSSTTGQTTGGASATSGSGSVSG